MMFQRLLRGLLVLHIGIINGSLKESSSTCSTILSDELNMTFLQFKTLLIRHWVLTPLLGWRKKFHLCSLLLAKKKIGFPQLIKLEEICWQYLPGDFMDAYIQFVFFSKYYYKTNFSIIQVKGFSIRSTPIFGNIIYNVSWQVVKTNQIYWHKAKVTNICCFVL